MEVLGVLLLWGVLGLGVEGVEAKEATEVKKEVEKIFKTVEDIMNGRSSELRRTSRTPSTLSSVSKGEKSRITEREFPTVTPSLSKPMARSYSNSMAPFPVGIVVSDHLYPLVVGRNAESGKPFVVNLEKQHAMIVASGGAGSGYRMLIPFPMMLGTPKFGGFNEEDPPLIPTPDFRNYPSKPLEYSSPHSSDIPEGKSIHREPVEDYSTGPHNYKYAEDYNYRDHDEAPYLEEPRYKYPMKSPKKYIFTTNPSSRPRGKLYSGGNYGAFAPDSRSRAPIRPAYLTNPEKSLSYYVEGPKYHPHVLPKKPLPIAYRHNVNPYSVNGPKYRSYMPGAPLPSRNSHYRNYYNDHPTYSSDHSAPKYPTVYGSVPSDFKPSPYIGEIDGYSRDNEDKDAAETTTLQPQSELFESYDERGEEINSEKDFDDTTSDSPEGRHASSGGVRHITYHADDYLGKIYEEMYYRLPSTERIDTDPDINLQSRSPQVFPLQDYEAERMSTVTEAADRRVDQMRAPQTEVADRRVDQMRALQTEDVDRRVDQMRGPQTEVADRRVDQMRALQTEAADRRVDQIRALQTEVADRRLDQNQPLNTETSISSKTVTK